MTLLVEKGTFTKTTSTGVPVSQQVNLSNGSLTPKLLILWTGGQTTSDGTYRDDARLSYGFSDGTNDACQAFRVDESLETEAYTFHNNAVIAIINLTTNAIVSQADVSAFAAGSFTLNWSVQSNTEALHIHYMVAGGTDITNVSCVSTTTGSTGTGNLSYNGSGTTFIPDFALTMTGADGYTTANAITTSADQALFCIGAAKSTTKEWVLWGRDETVATSDADMYLNPDACLAACSNTTGAITYLADFVSFNSAAGGGITVNVSDGADATTKKLAFLFVKGAQWDCGGFQQRNGTGTQDVTTATDFDPSLVFLGGINSASSATVVANNHIGIGASDGTNEGAVYSGNTNALGTFAAVNSNIHTKVYRMSTPHATATSSTTNAECDLTGMTPGKFTLDWTTADSTLRRMAFWALAPALERVDKTLTLKWNIWMHMHNHSVVFDGTNDLINCGNHTDLWSQGLTKFSFACWIYPTLQDGSNRAFTQCGNGVPHRFFSEVRQVAGDVRFSIRNSADTAFVIASSSALVLNKWNHIACVYDNSLGSANIKIYVDKVVGGTTGDLTETVSVSADMTLGGGPFSDMQGNMKDFRWYTTIALTQTEIDNIYANNTSAPTPNYWLKMNEGSATPVDSIAGKTTTLDNGATWANISPGVWNGKHLALKWNVIGRVSKALTLKWNIIGRILKDLTLKWNIEASLERVLKDLILKWNIQSRTTKNLILKWNIIGRVSKTLTLKWNIIERISKALTLKWNIIGRISKDLILKWHIIGRINKALTVKWNIVGRISKTLTLKWNIDSRILKDLILKWNIQQRLNKLLTLKWNIDERVLKNTILKWHITNFVSKTLTLKWNIINFITKSLTIKWNIIGRISKNLTLKWNLIGRISKTLTLKWNLIGRILKDLTLKWNIDERISKALTLKWNLIGRISKDTILKWNIIGRVSKNLILKWDIIGRISKNLTLKWDIMEGDLERVTKNLILKWNLIGRISKPLTLKWNITNSVSKTLTLKWNIQNRVIKDLILKWNIIERVTKNLTLKWHIINFISKTLTLKWNIDERISKNLTLKWNIHERIIKPLTLKWNIIGRVSKDLTLKWNLIGRISKNLTLKWDILEEGLTRITKDVILKWNIIERTTKNLTLKWTITNFVTKSLILKWHITNFVSKSLTLKWDISGRVIKNIILKWNILSEARTIIFPGKQPSYPINSEGTRTKAEGKRTSANWWRNPFYLPSRTRKGASKSNTG